MELIGSLISIIGVSAIFGQDLLVIALIIALDFAKVLTVSFLYQHWDGINRLAKFYLSSAVVVLVVATSSGAGGYLSGKVQQAARPTAGITISLEKIANEKQRLERERAEFIATKQSLDTQIARLPDDKVQGRQQLLRSFKPELERIRTGLTRIDARLPELEDERAKLESSQLDKQQEQGPLVQMAKSLDISIDVLSKWIIALIVLIFDPLAIALVIAANFMIKKKREARAQAAALAPPPVVITPAPITAPPPTTEGLSIGIVPGIPEDELEQMRLALDTPKPMEIISPVAVEPTPEPTPEPTTPAPVPVPIEMPPVVITPAPITTMPPVITPVATTPEPTIPFVSPKFIDQGYSLTEADMMIPFIDRCLSGKADPANLQQEINHWWNNKKQLEPIATYLGLTPLEYEVWLADPSIFPTLLQARRDGVALETLLKNN